MAINTNQSPAETLAADTKSGLQDLIQTGSSKKIDPQKDDLVKVASLTGIVNQIVQEGTEGATKKKATGPVVPKNVETVEEAITSVNKAKEILDQGDTSLKGFETSEDIISNLKATADDIEMLWDLAAALDAGWSGS